MEKKLSKSEFMALVINHHYEKKLHENELRLEADNYMIGVISKQRDKRMKRRGF